MKNAKYMIYAGDNLMLGIEFKYLSKKGVIAKLVDFQHLKSFIKDNTQYFKVCR